MYKPINQANRRGWLAKEIRYGTQICFMNEISGITANLTGFMLLYSREIDSFFSNRIHEWRKRSDGLDHPS